MQRMHRLLAAALCSLSMLALAAGPTVQTQQGIRYINGGIGAEEQEALAAVKKDFNVRLLFANKGSGEFRADVQLSLQDDQGRPLLTLKDVGPRLYLQLAPGQYKLQAAVGAQVQTQTIKLAAGQAREATFYWEDK